MLTKIPLSIDPNQTFTTTISGSTKNLTLKFTISYNRQAGYWIMGIYDHTTGDALITNMPLLPDHNLLRQYQYLDIGTVAVLVNIGDPTVLTPDDTNLASNFALFWEYDE